MMIITGLSHLFKWENLHNWWLTKYFFAPLYLGGRGQDHHNDRTEQQVLLYKNMKSMSEEFSFIAQLSPNYIDLIKCFFYSLFPAD